MKATDTGLTLNFHALAPMKYKRSVIIGFVHRVYRSSSSWHNIHMGLEKAKSILVNNQYPVNLVEDIFKETLNKLVTCNVDSSDTESGHDETLDVNACIHNVPDKDKYLFFLEYRGKPSEHFAHALRKLNAPCRIIMTLVKTKSEVSALKTPVPHMLQNNLVYQINCPGCSASYVGQTSRLLQQRFKEHMGSRGLIKNHFELCGTSPLEDQVKILGKNRGDKLMSLEALFIHRLKPTLNSKDEYKSRVLKLKF